jgi:hypothetical protein
LTDTSSQQTNTSSIPPSSSMELQPRKSRETPDLTKPKSIIQTKQEDTKKGRKQGGEKRKIATQEEKLRQQQEQIQQNNKKQNTSD